MAISDFSTPIAPWDHRTPEERMAQQLAMRRRFEHGTSGLDPIDQRRQMELLASLQERYGSLKNAVQAQQPNNPNSFFDTLGPSDPYGPQRERILSMILAEGSRPQERVEFPSPYTPEQIQQYQDELKRSQALGGLLQASGDEALGAMGKTLAGRPDPLDFMHDINRFEQVRRYQEWQANMPRDRITALSRALDALDSKGRPPPVSALNQMIKEGTEIEGLGNIRENFRDEYQQVLGRYTSIFKDVPPWAVRNGLEDFVHMIPSAEDQQTLRDSANWWAEFHRIWIAPGRHELFGATLTQGEQRAWDDVVGITAATAPEEVRRRLNQLFRAKVENSRRRAKTYSEVYGRDVVEAAYGDLLDYGDAPRQEEDQGGDPILDIDTSGRTTGTPRSNKRIIGGVEVEILEE